MPAVSRLVSPSERIHLVTREHGVVLVPSFLRAALAIVLFGGGALQITASSAPEPLQWAAAVFAGLVVAFSMFGLIRRVARWHSRRLIVTDERIVFVSGVLGRRVASVALDGITGLSIGMSGAGRLLRYGRVEINMNGRRGALFGLRRLRDPDLVTALLLGLAEPPQRARQSRRNRPVEWAETAGASR